jgi:transcriptional regulator with AAA-type ATPase domain
VAPANALRQLAARRPDLLLEVGLRLSQTMAGRAAALAGAVQEEERRQRALAPYLVAAPKRGIIGRSKYADRLRKQVCARRRRRRRFC